MTGVSDSHLTFDEKVNLLIRRWWLIDLPERYRYCWRLRPYRWLASFGVLRHRETTGAKRSTFDGWVGWTITVTWVQVWWYHRV